MSNTTTTRFNLNIPVRLRLYITYWTFALILFAYLFGIMKHPMRDLSTLNARDYREFVKLDKQYKANQTKMIELERLEYVSNDGITNRTIQNIENKIKILKEKNLLNLDKSNAIYRKAKYQSWQYRLADYMGWDFPFNLHRK